MHLLQAAEPEWHDKTTKSCIFLSYPLSQWLLVIATDGAEKLCGEQDVQVECLERDAYRQVWILKGIDHFLE